MQSRFFWLVALLALPAAAAEFNIDFSEFHEGQTPPGFRSTVMGEGKPGVWKVILDDVPSLMPALLTNAPAMAKKAVLEQVSEDPTDEHFPMFIYDGQAFGDFTLTTHIKTVRGAREQMAGVAFRIQNETNYYVVRISSLGHNFRWYKVVNGQRGELIGPQTDIPAGAWHELQIECSGDTIKLRLDGQQSIPMITDHDFARGKIGFWTKSDSVSYFGDTKIAFTPVVSAAQTLMHDMAKKYTRLVDLKIYVPGKEPDSTRVAAGKDPKEAGQPGGAAEQDVIRRGLIYYGKGKGTVTVTMPLHDRNGDVMGAVRIVMKSFPGETEETALERATPVMKEVQDKATALDNFFE
jgi:hypothetical protein